MSPLAVGALWGMVLGTPAGVGLSLVGAAIFKVDGGLEDLAWLMVGAIGGAVVGAIIGVLVAHRWEGR